MHEESIYSAPFLLQEDFLKLCYQKIEANIFANVANGTVPIENLEEHQTLLSNWQLKVKTIKFNTNNDANFLQLYRTGQAKKTPDVLITHHKLTFSFSLLAGLVSEQEGEVEKNGEMLGQEHDHGGVRTLRRHGQAFPPPPGHHPQKRQRKRVRRPVAVR